MKWILLLSLGLVIGSAAAEQPIVLDNQAIGDQQGASKAGAAAVNEATAPADSAADVNANKERILKGARVSPREKAALAKAEAGEANKEEGANFLSTNAAKKGVTTLASGVQYKILRAGKGKKPTEGSRISCRYKGTLIDGTSFDKTEDKKPSVMHVSGFVPGLKEAVLLMPTGSKWEIVVPPQLAYGAIGNRGVGSNAVLIYQMEILSIK